MKDNKTLLDVAHALMLLVEGPGCARWEDGHGFRLKDMPEWAAFYCAVKACALERDTIAGERNALAAEVGLLRTILSKCATAIGNGASAAPDCSLEFLSGIPEEIALFSGKLREDAERYRWLRNDANTANNSAPMVATNPLDYEIQRLIHGDELDTAIDKARAEAGHG